MKYSRLICGLSAATLLVAMAACAPVGPGGATEPDTTPATEPETAPLTAPVTEAPTEPETADIPAALSTDKDTYEVGEAITVTATGNDGDTVAFYPADFTVGEQSPIYYAAFAGEDAIPRDTPVALSSFPGTNRRKAEVAFYYGVLPVGDYRLVITNEAGDTRAEALITIVDTAEGITTGVQLAARCLDVALNYKTLYVNGCFGAPMTESNKDRYTQNTAFNRRPERQEIIRAASADTFGFDCVCFIKGLFWGWSGDENHVYGGASYASNGVPDITEGAMLESCDAISSNFRRIEVGEVVWLDGHIGVYIGNGLAVECTPSWDDCVQITACNTSRPGYNARTWTKHGKLPYIEYTGVYESVRNGLPAE